MTSAYVLDLRGVGLMAKRTMERPPGDSKI
jgi:hypothetical protein